MPVIILNKSYRGVLSTQVLEEMCLAVKALPEPKISSASNENINPEEALLCLQQEAIYVDQFTNRGEIKYMGSKYVYECILVYIHSETDHLLVHVDITRVLDFTNYIKNFNYKNKLIVTLVGGAPDQQSEENLRLIVRALNEAAEKLDIAITIESQKIIENNRFTENDKYDFIFDKTLKKIDIICRQFFNKPLDRNRLQHRTALDFKTRSVKDKISQQLLMLVTAMYSQVTELYDKKTYEKVNFMFNVFRQQVPTEQQFMELADLTFSQECFALQDMGFTMSKKYNPSSLCSFVFNLESHVVHRISICTETPREVNRIISLADRFQPPRYHLFYNGRQNQYVFPPISEKFIEGCLNIKSTMRGNIVDRQHIAKTLGVECVEILNFLGKYINSLDEKKKSTFDSQVAFFSSKKLFCHSLRMIEKTQNLITLNQITGRQFLAVLRDFPEYTVDAIYYCDSEDKCDVLKSELKSKGIFSVAAKISDNIYCICVPAINVGHYAETINKYRS